MSGIQNDKLFWVFYETAPAGPGDGPYRDESYAEKRAKDLRGEVVGVDVASLYTPHANADWK